MDNFFNINEHSKYDLLVLKGHLLIEEELNQILTLISKQPKFIKDKRFNFDSKVAIIRSIDIDGNNKNWDLIISINKLRNNIAHSLPSKRDKKKLLNVLKHPIETDFRELIEEDQYPLVPEETKHFIELHSSIYSSLIFLHTCINRLQQA
ncbi:TPA: hypothetical protein ACPYPK_001025 [Legionella pneumophila]|nr:hypothetical protein [Legionella pneumophila]HAU1997200.1 hypothetical protein [Legionella pneumophila]